MSDDISAPNVVVLGAGFSRAVCDVMPTANRLGEMAYERLAHSRSELIPRFSDDYPFETWLSLLAEGQPYLRETENRERQAEFSRLRDAVVDSLDAVQAEALAHPPPRWFRELLSALHYTQSTVISLNYDTIVEAGLASQYLERPGSSIEGRGVGWRFTDTGEMDYSIAAMVLPAWSVGPVDVLRNLPKTETPPRITTMKAPATTMRLLKLHGSLDWWWVPGDQTGATLSRYETGATFGKPTMLTNDDRGSELPGRERFIVPPLATKSAYYGNPITRQLWQDAFKALRAAPRIALLGYSLPQADFVMSGMLESAIRQREVEVIVANPAPDGPCHRIAALGGPDALSGQLRVFAEASCLGDFTLHLCNGQSAQVVRELTPWVSRLDSADDAKVTWSNGGSRANNVVVRTELTTDGTLVVTSRSEPFNHDDDREGRPSARSVGEEVSRATRVVARSEEDGNEGIVVGYTTGNLSDPNARHWINLIPAGELAD
jgi:hypothetical protein